MGDLIDIKNKASLIINNQVFPNWLNPSSDAIIINEFKLFYDSSVPHQNQYYSHYLHQHPNVGREYQQFDAIQIQQPIQQIMPSANTKIEQKEESKMDDDNVAIDDPVDTSASNFALNGYAADFKIPLLTIKEKAATVWHTEIIQQQQKRRRKNSKKESNKKTYAMMAAKNMN